MAEEGTSVANWIDSNKKAMLDVLMEVSDGRFSNMSNKKAKWELARDMFNRRTGRRLPPTTAIPRCLVPQLILTFFYCRIELHKEDAHDTVHCDEEAMLDLSPLRPPKWIWYGRAWHSDCFS